MTIGSLVIGQEAPPFSAKIVKVDVFSHVKDTRYKHKPMVVREYVLEDNTGAITLTTFNKDLKKQAGDIVKLTRALCRADKYWSKKLVLGKWGVFE